MWLWGCIVNVIAIHFADWFSRRLVVRETSHYDFIRCALVGGVELENSTVALAFSFGGWTLKNMFFALQSTTFLPILFKLGMLMV